MTHYLPRLAAILPRVCLCLAALLLPQPVRGADAPAGRKYALLVGVRTYQKDQLKNLKYTENDVNDLAGLLRAGGYRRVVLMTQTEASRDQTLDPTAQNIRDHLKAILEDRKAEDTVLVAFSGHGVQFKGSKETYFCPADCRLTDKTTLIALAEVFRSLQECPAGRKVVVADASRFDPQPNNNGPAKVDLESVTRLQAEKAPEGLAALFSCSDGQFSYESDALKHGVFFNYLIEGFKGKAADKRGEVTLERLASYVKEEVPERVKGEEGPRARQAPRLVGELAGSSTLLSDEPGDGPDAETVESGKPRPYVVVVGVGDYRDKQILPRPHAEDDARALFDLLTDKDRYGLEGVDAKRARLLLGFAGGKSGPGATRQNILDSLRWLAAKAGPNDPVFFAFFGAGAPLGDYGDRHCYLAADSTFKGRDNNAVSAADVAEALKGLKSQQFAVFLDVNFKGFTLPTDGKPIPEAKLADRLFAEFRGDADSDFHVRMLGRAFFAADHTTAASLDGPDHGVFAMALLDGLRGDADAEGGEADGLVTVDELGDFLVRQVPELARKYGKTDKDKGQGASWRSGLNSRFVLSYNPRPHQEARARLAKFERLVKDGKLSAELAEEGRVYLGRTPRLESQRRLRKEYQKLADGAMTPADLVAARDKIHEGTRLPGGVAEKFAAKVIGVTQIIQSSYYMVENQDELAAQAVRKLYQFVEERIPEALEARLKKVKDLNEKQLTELLIDARAALGKREDLDKDKDINVALVEMLYTLDPYTTYIDPDALDRFKQRVLGAFSGIGITVYKDAASDMLRVVTPIKGSPAYKAGLQTGDLITKITREVDGQGAPLPQAEETPTPGLTINDATKKMLGKEGTKVKLTIRREGVDKPLEFEIARGRIETETVLGVARRVKDDWDFMLDDEKKIGYLRLSAFHEKSYDDLAAAMVDLKKGGMKGFILDLRSNSGGLISIAADIADLFIDDGVIVSIRSRGKREDSLRGKHEGSLLDFPMVCLVNGESGSTSEIVAACLQDHGRATVIGERTFGVNSIQNIRRFGDGELKLTTATFWRPSGKNLDKHGPDALESDNWGVKPDLVVPLTEKERGDLRDHLLSKEIIPRRDASGKTEKDPKSEFKDMQLEQAVDYLTDQLKASTDNPVKKPE